MREQQSVSYFYAGFGVRLFAWLVDMALISVLLVPLRVTRFFLSLLYPLHILSRAILFRYSLFDIFLYLLPVIYFVAMTWSFGATLGKMLLNLQVVSAEGRTPTLREIILRELFGRYLSTAVLMIGYLMAVPDDEKRTLHDRLADTRVVYRHGIYASAPVTALSVSAPASAPGPSTPEAENAVPVVETVSDAPGDREKVSLQKAEREDGTA